MVFGGSRKIIDMQIHSVGINLGKTTFHLVALNAAGKVLLRKNFTQKQLITFTANIQISLIGMEACAGLTSSAVTCSRKMIFYDRPVYQEEHIAQLIMARRPRYPPKGRIHLRRPVNRLRFSLAVARRTIHFREPTICMVPSASSRLVLSYFSQNFC